ncbi:MAG: anthranilate synthase component I [Deltaproteobacteria bacterium]|nr:anthranilate synthase component I [Deltaproteobacteria bacterium]
MANRPTIDDGQYTTRGGITVHRRTEELPVDGAIEPVIDGLDTQRGVLLASSYEYPGRYTRWDMGFIDPPLVLQGRQRTFSISALNQRGEILLPLLSRSLDRLPAVDHLFLAGSSLDGTIAATTERFTEENRSKQPSIFSVIRALLELFHDPDESHLGLYGAFGYDLAFQFEPIRLRLARNAVQRDIVLYLPDEIIVVDHRRERANRLRYDFDVDGNSTRGMARTGSRVAYEGAERVERACDHTPGEYAAGVRVARDAFRRGDLFEVVPSQTFFDPCPAAPSEIFRRLRERNPAPYGFLMNLGDGEYLVGASPEMYVRVEGDRIETCPIAGTIARGSDPIGDAAQIARLLNSTKDESELTMCTDVDRNDKSRICIPGSVRVIGRRQIEMYSRLIHTVDHVEGRLRPEFDALDGFLTHTWAVTVTGAPKTWAMQFIEDHEKSPRLWYGGSIGMIGFDGNLNTGLTLRTIRIQDGVAEVRVGATLLYDSDPDEEERETHVKGSALLDAIRRPRTRASVAPASTDQSGAGKRLLLVDHQDSFVHTLANYFRQTGAEVITLRSGFDHAELDRLQPHLVVLSPGPGTPQDFNVSATIAAALARHLPLFGVCLGLQGMVEHFGGRLGVLDYPMHGKPSRIRILGGRIFEGLPREITAGRYHSLFGIRESLPAELIVTAESDDGVVMAIEHTTLPLAAVQFHPESILTLADDVGRRLVSNVVAVLAGNPG